MGEDCQGSDGAPADKVISFCRKGLKTFMDRYLILLLDAECCGGCQRVGLVAEKKNIDLASR